jgi:protein TonB
MARDVLFALFISVAMLVASPLMLLADKTEERCKHASALLSQGDLQGAQTEFEDILRKKPNYENAKVLLGVTLTKLSEQAEKKGDRTAAVAELREALQLDPDEAYWHSALARLLSSQGAGDEARKEWSQAAQLSPDDWSLAQTGGSGASQEIKKEGGTTPEVKAPAPARADSVGDVTPPVPIEKPEPPYTEKARKAHYSGTVVLWLLVDAQGDVKQAQVMKPLGLGLDQNALRSVRTWKFRPATRHGTPVPVRVMVSVSFKLF